MSYDRSLLINAPWKGWDQSLPSVLLPPTSFKKITGWLINKGRLQQFPNLAAFTGPPDGEVIQGASTFMDVLGFLHTGVLTKDHVYYLNNTNTYTLLGSTSSPSNESFVMEVFLNKLFYTNGRGFLNFLDGSNSINVAGDVPGAAFVIGKLASSLILANTFENGGFNPTLVRWSAVNNGSEWNSATDPTAGSAQVPEIEDQINGFANQDGQGVLFRSKGITIMSPTGSLAPRFTFSSFSAGPAGIGENYPYTLGNYGDASIFVAENDIFMMKGLSQPVPIGGGSKKKIFQDLAVATGDPWACFLGALGVGIDYLAYWLNIPQSDNSLTSTWIFHLDDQTWVNEQLPYGGNRWMGNIAVS